MSNDIPEDPGKRLNKIVAGGEKDEVYTRLPKAKEIQPTVQTTAVPRPAAVQPPPASQKPKESPFKDMKFGPAFWNVTGILSLVVNCILIGVLLALSQYLGVLSVNPKDFGTSLVGGLFTNFEKMDAATIRTTIPVDTSIPLDITVPVQTTTQITLANEVVIDKAHVRINTPNINIDSDAQVTLPAGTPLTINLNFTLPVQTDVPVHLDVDVVIPLKDTELHDPFVGLQEVIRPLYCMLMPGATRLNSDISVCK